MKLSVAIITLALHWCLNSTASSQGNFWHQANGPYGGDVSCVVSDSFGNIFIGTDWSGVFRSTNAGESWKSASSGLTWSGHVIYHLAVTPENDLLAGTFDGLFISSNHGDSWTPIDEFKYSIVTALFVSRHGAVFAQTDVGPLLRSTDGGDSWTSIGNGLTGAVHATVENLTGVIFAGTQTYRSPYWYEGRLYRSSDGGNAWTLLNLGTTFQDIPSLAVNSKNELFAATGGEGIYRSTDSGSTWSRADSGLPLAYVYSLAVGRDDTLLAAIASPEGIFCSADDGKSWTPCNQGLTNPNVKAIHVSRAGRVFAGTNGGGIYFHSGSTGGWNQSNSGLLNTWILSIAIAPNGYLFAGTNGSGLFRSTNSGGEWQSVNNGLTSSPIHSVAVDSSGYVYLGTEDGVFRSVNSGVAWSRVSAAGTKINALCISRRQIVLAASYRGVSRSIDHGETWTQTNNGLQDLSVNCLGANPYNGFVYAGTGNVTGSPAGLVFQTTDNGDTWTRIDAELPSTYIYSLAIDSRGLIYAGTYSYGIFRSSNNGFSWTNVGIPMVLFPSVTCIAINSKQDLYVGVYYSPAGNGVFKSTDQGATWTSVDAGWTTTPVGTLAFDASDILYAGTFRYGVYASEKTTTAVPQQSDKLPLAFNVAQNYPNPFNPSTTIHYDLPISANVSLNIYNTLGQLVAMLVNEHKEAGYYQVAWNATVPSGIYFYRLQVGEYLETKKMILLK